MVYHKSHKSKGFHYLKEAQEEQWFKDGFYAGMSLWFKQKTFLETTTIQQMETKRRQKEYDKLFNFSIEYS